MQERISPARRVEGSLVLPGDKSISHRFAMLAGIAEGTSRIANYSTGADCQSTLGCMRALGAEVEKDGNLVTIKGRAAGLTAPSSDLDAGNSGSTIRMLSGILAAQPFRSRIFGDESLSRRPMQRIMQPLAQMGATLTAREGKFPPIEIQGGPLRAIDYTLPVPSAQVKTCVLFAGLFAEGETVVRESVRSRDHSEIALREFGADISVEKGRIAIQGGAKLAARDLVVPSDLSSAAFFIVAALLLPGSNLAIRGVGLNPTRSLLLDFLMGMGAKIQLLDIRQENGETMGDLLIQSAPLRGGEIAGATTAALIDEIPVLAVLGAATEQGLTVRDASELRIKETDRVATVVENLRKLGVAAEELPDGMVIPGRQTFRGGTFDSHGDHRIAMAFAVAALRADGDSVIENADAAAVSFPEFFTLLRQVAE